MKSKAVNPWRPLSVNSDSTLIGYFNRDLSNIIFLQFMSLYKSENICH